MQKSLEVSLFLNSTIVEDKDLIAFLNGAHSVSNNDRCSSHHGNIEGSRYFGLGIFVQSGSSLIKEKNLWFSNDGSGDCDSLLLSSRKLSSFDTTLSRFKSVTENNILLGAMSGVDVTDHWLEPILFLFISFHFSEALNFFIVFGLSNKLDKFIFVALKLNSQHLGSFDISLSF
jgi:hypothetical protein